MESIINAITTKAKQEMKTPIEIALGVDENGMTTAKKLYEFLELNPKNYSHWCKANITDNEFATENEDYEVFVAKDENPLGGRPTQDYKLTAHFAKKLSCKGNGEKAELAREYFATVEERAKEYAIKKSQENNKPSLDSVNTTANILERVYRLAGTDDRYLALLVGSVYREFGMEFTLPVFEMDMDKLYDQTMIANELGIMSTSGKPHAQAAGAIIEMLNVPEDDTISTPYTNHGHSGVVVQYKPKVLGMVREWLEDNQYPRTIAGKNKKYSVLYR